MFNKLREILNGGQRFLVATHVDPDGDALGSAFALCFALTALGKETAVYLKDTIPYQYRFLPRPVHILHETPENRIRRGHGCRLRRLGTRG